MSRTAHISAADHQDAVIRFLREFKPDGWRLSLTKRHDGTHAVLRSLADAGLIDVEREPDAWTYRPVAK